jgi:hypothetical protein
LERGLIDRTASPSIWLNRPRIANPPLECSKCVTLEDYQDAGIIHTFDSFILLEAARQLEEGSSDLKFPGRLTVEPAEAV